MRQSKKELIRETAVEVFARLGYHNATTDRIAEEAGVAVGTIYNYFRSKEEILEYIFLVELEKRKKFYAEINRCNAPFYDKMRKLLDLHFSEVAKKPEVGQILVREQQFPRKNDLTAITAYLEGIPRAIQRMLDEAIEQKEIDQCNTRLVGAALFGAVQAVVNVAVYEENDDERKKILCTAADGLADFFWKGLKTIS